MVQLLIILYALNIVMTTSAAQGLLENMLGSFVSGVSSICISF